MDATTGPVLSARDLHKRYGGSATPVDALRGVDLDLAAGEFVAIMGASGSGKSTLLHLLAGLTTADQGTVHIGGSDLAAMNDRALTRFRRSRLGMVFQAYNLIPVLSARENVALPLTLDGAPDQRAREQAEAALATVGLADRGDHLPDQLSGGEQQRVAIARALVGDPAIIFADEPTGNLDSVASEMVCRLLAQLTTEHGCALLLVTHEPAVARWAQRVLVLADGAVVADFPTAGLDDAAALARRYQELIATGSCT
ncbi:MAG: ABC transporter ATP-binding protein [Planctomycetota bacterium]